MLDPNAHDNRTRETRTAEPWPHASWDGRRWTATPPGTAPHRPRGTQHPTGHASQGDSAAPPHLHTRAHSTWIADPDDPPFRHPHSAQRQPTRPHAVGPVLGPNAHTNRTRDTEAADPRLPAPKGGRPGEGQRLTPHAPHNGGRPPLPGTAPHQPRGTQPPTGYANQGDSAGPPHPPTRTHSTWVADPDSPPRGQLAGGGGAPGLRRPSRRGKTPPPRRRPSATPRARNDGSQGRTLWGQCWVPTPTPTAAGTQGPRNSVARPKGRAAGRGTAPDTRRPSQWWEATPHGPPPPPGHAAPRRARKPRGQCWAPTPAQPRPQHVGRVPRQPAQRAGSRGRRSA